MAAILPAQATGAAGRHEARHGGAKRRCARSSAALAEQPLDGAAHALDGAPHAVGGRLRRATGNAADEVAGLEATRGGLQLRALWPGKVSPRASEQHAKRSPACPGCSLFGPSTMLSRRRP